MHCMVELFTYCPTWVQNDNMFDSAWWLCKNLNYLFVLMCFSRCNKEKYRVKASYRWWNIPSTIKKVSSTCWSHWSLLSGHLVYASVLIYLVKLYPYQKIIHFIIKLIQCYWQNLFIVDHVLCQPYALFTEVR